MKKILSVVLVLAFLLLSCGSSIDEVRGSGTGPIQAQLIATGGGSKIFKFSDGGMTCYFTESNNASYGGGIWCGR